MIYEQAIIDALDLRVNRRTKRREFMGMAGAGLATVAGTSLLGACNNNHNPTPMPTPTPTPAPTPTPTPPPLGDADIFNFALNLEYLEAEFYSYAALGVGLDASLLTGTGTQGATKGGRMVNFTDPVVRAYANEIAQDEIDHVRFLRNQLGGAKVAQPTVDISADPNGAFSSAARAAGLIGAGESFDPYASDENFLLAAFIFEDVGVTAYKGAAPLITNKTLLEAAAGILGAEAYHAGLIRTVLYRKGVATPVLRTATEKISDARDSLDGPTDDDQGVAPRDGGSNIVPTDENGLAYSRSAGQVLNVVYLNAMAVTRGGFFPDGVNGRINMSAASG